MTHEIPKPQLLDPNRVDRDEREGMTADDHRSRAQLLSTALEETCGYAGQLWDQLDELRRYLLASLPPDPRLPGPHTRTSAAPTGPDDEPGWQSWMNAFATTVSTLCGAHGDSGFGASRAREEAQLRRNAPEMLLHQRHPSRPEPKSAPAPAPAPAPAAAIEKNASKQTWSPVKIAASALVAVLALRGLQPRRRRA
jgi:hypothetical protein